MAVMGVSSEACWMVGDTPMDMLAAKAADIECVAVRCGYAGEEQLREHTPNIAKNAYEAVQFIVES